MGKVEAVARALAQHVGPYAFDDCPKDRKDLRENFRGRDVNDLTQSDLLEAARAAIEAMKGPSETMLNETLSPAHVADLWDRMLQAALDE